MKFLIAVWLGVRGGAPRSTRVPSSIAPIREPDRVPRPCELVSTLPNGGLGAVCAGQGGRLWGRQKCWGLSIPDLSQPHTKISAKLGNSCFASMRFEVDPPRSMINAR